MLNMSISNLSDQKSLLTQQPTLKEPQNLQSHTPKINNVIDLGFSDKKMIQMGGSKGSALNVMSQATETNLNVSGTVTGGMDTHDLLLPP